MARSFASTQYITFGDNAIGPAMHGAAYVSVHHWVYYTTLQALGASNISFLVVCGGGASLFLYVSAAGKPVVTARSATADASSTAVGATTLVTGRWYSFGCVIDYAADDILIYIDGSLDGSLTTATFSSATYAHTTVTPGAYDRLGHANGAQSFIGRQAETALWTADMRDRMSDLAAGYAPEEIGSPAIHLPLWGVDSPEPDMRGNVTGTLSGPTQAEHPRIVMPSRRSVVVPDFSLGRRLHAEGLFVGARR